MESEVTVNELEELCAEIAKQRDVLDVIDAQKKEENKKLIEFENKLLEMFRSLGKSSYPSKVGTLSVTHRMSVKLPANPEDKKAFFTYLKDRGLFEDMVGVHSATLNSFYKAEFEAAKDRGEGLDFALPGINTPTINETVSFRAAKN